MSEEKNEKKSEKWYRMTRSKLSWSTSPLAFVKKPFSVMVSPGTEEVEDRGGRKSEDSVLFLALYIFFSFSC